MDVTPQWNVNTLVSETPQAREDRRRKVGDLFSIPKFTHDGSVQKELKKLAKSHGSGSLPQHTPAALANTDRTPGPRTTTPKPPVTSNPVGNPQIPTTTATNITPSEHTPVDLSQKRGKKRELEESGTTLSPQQIHRQATPPASVVNSLNGVRPRPIKKQRVVRYPPISSTTSRSNCYQRMSRDWLRRKIFHSSSNPLHRVFETYKLTRISHPAFRLRILHL